MADRVSDGATSDAESFTAWAAHAQRRLLRTAVLLTGDHQRAEDLVQEALVKVALRRWRPPRQARGRRRTRGRCWCATTSRGGASTVARCSSSRRTAGRGTSPRQRPTACSSTTRWRALTPRQRADVVLRYYDDLTERATAEALGVAVGTVKSQTHLALRRLAEARRAGRPAGHDVGEEVP